jgi:cytochrome c oxidase cbb3-type subunit III
MKKYSPLFVILSAILLAAFCLPGYKAPVVKNNFTDSLLTPLAVYGSYIYQREACAHCHSLVYDSTDSKRLSLDGLGKRQFADSWHYRHMMDPGSLSLDSKMPAFPALFINTINAGKLKQLYQQQGYPQSSNHAVIRYKKLQQQAASIAQQLQAQGISGNNLQQKEIIALIAYLQQIPTGPQRRYKDSLWIAAQKNQALAWDNTNLEDSSSIMQLANSTGKETIAAGANLFIKRICYVCHGRQGEGGVGPNLTDEYWLHGSSSKQIMRVIANGIPDHGMQAFKAQLTPEQIASLTAFINTIKNTDPPNAKVPQGKKE